MLTMLLGGLWHGANWTFLIWGGLHGCYLIINHAWRGLLARTGRDHLDGVAWRVTSRLLTLLAVMLAWVFFRADSLTSALQLLRSMAGMAPTWIAESTSLVEDRFSLSLIEPNQLLILLGLLAVVSFAPNSQQIVGYDNARQTEDRSPGAPFSALRWQPTVAWAALTALLCLLSLVGMSETREFVYFRF